MAKKLMRAFIAAGIVAGSTIAAWPTQSDATGNLSPYVALQKREIKSMSRDEISRYLSGRGIKIALTGELNHYPGPRDSLELQRELKLTKKQRQRTRLIYERLRADSVKFGTLIVTREKRLNKLFASQKARFKSVKKLLLRIAKLKGELRLAHLKYHMQMKRLLSREQIASYDRLRGYKSRY